MGYSFFRITYLNDHYRQKLNSFVESLGPAVGEGRKISFADNDISCLLAFQHKRIKDKGLDFEYEIYDRDARAGAMVTAEWKDDRYESCVCNEQYGVARKISKGGRKLYSDRKRNILYATVTDVASGIHPDSETISCPNCGSISTIAQVQEGCPYCGTMYKMDDLFPKVTGYWFLEDVGIAPNEHKTGLRLSMLLTAVIFILIMLIRTMHRGEAFGIETILGSVLLIPLGLLVGYMLYSLFLLVRLITVGSGQSRGKWGTIGSRKKFEQKMKPIFPDFSYEYFTGKAISLIKTAVFASDEQKLLFYKGEPLDSSFRNIIDMNYGGALGLSDFKQENGRVTITTDAFFEVLYAEGDRITNRREKFRAVFLRRTDIPFDMQFSMTRIQCPSCGGSFNAIRNKYCPYCGRAYQLESHDWIICELHRV